VKNMGMSQCAENCELTNDAEILPRFGAFIFFGGLPGGVNLGILRRIFHGPIRTAGGFMEWTAPAFQEVCLNCEINSYASAKL